jgi:hypothetical protein
MAERYHTEVKYDVRDYWRGVPHARDARIDEVEVLRRVSRYPVAKNGNIQWSRHEDEEPVLLRTP